MQTSPLPRFSRFAAVLRDGVRRCLRRVARAAGGGPRPAPPAVPAQAWHWQLRNELAALTGFGEQVLARLGSVQPPKPDDATNSTVLLILDEMLTNVIKYAHPGEAPGHRLIDVRLQVADGEVGIEIEDDGMAFDPTAGPLTSADADVPLEERTVGGWGLSLVRRTADAMSYRRAHERNHVTLRKRFAAHGVSSV